MTKVMISQVRIFTFILFSIFVLGGCVLQDIGRSVQNTVKGEYYLNSKKYSEGSESFLRSIKKNPSDASAHYYLGRFLLTENRGNDALPYLQEAVKLSPGKADYYFWLGVAQGAVGYSKQERECYEKALSLNGRHLQAMTYLAHKQLEGEEYSKALVGYQRVLKIWPESPSSLYNRALIMKKLGRSQEERLAWRSYLDFYPAGPMARRAADNLNWLGDFQYRNYTIGTRTITLHKIVFQPFSHKLDSDSYPSLILLGSILENMKEGTLQVVVYQKNNLNLAKKRAKSIRDYILNKNPNLESQRVKLSWFDPPEEINVSGKILKNNESVQFFLTK